MLALDMQLTAAALPRPAPSSSTPHHHTTIPYRVTPDTRPQQEYIYSFKYGAEGVEFEMSAAAHGKKKDKYNSKAKVGVGVGEGGETGGGGGREGDSTVCVSCCACALQRALILSMRCCCVVLPGCVFVFCRSVAALELMMCAIRCECWVDVNVG